LNEEIDLAKTVYGLMRQNPSIGYEAANHYYFTQNMMTEKVLNCQELKRGLIKK
jgi:hypothetical protein